MWRLPLRSSHVSTAATQSLLVTYILRSREAQISQSRENRKLLNPEVT